MCCVMERRCDKNEAFIWPDSCEWRWKAGLHLPLHEARESGRVADTSILTVNYSWQQLAIILPIGQWSQRMCLI